MERLRRFIQEHPELLNRGDLEAYLDTLSDEQAERIADLMQAFVASLSQLRRTRPPPTTH